MPLRRSRSGQTTRRWRLLATWLVVAGLFGAGLLTSRSLQDPLDDADLAYQRPGFLDPQGSPLHVPGLACCRHPGHPTLVVFVRRATLAEVVTLLAGHPDVRRHADPVIVVAGAGDAGVIGGIPVLTDADGQLAAAFGMRRPRDGGPSVGYAIVDQAGLVRYQTLDPGMAGRLAEVDTMVRATP